MKKIILSLLALMSVAAMHAQSPDAVYKLIRQEWTVNDDGTSDYHYRHEVQILRNRALTAYADKGETFVLYNPDLEDLTINEVYTIQSDGNKVAMPQNAFIYQLPSQCADCGRFAHMRELAMVHTGMELGCIIVVDYSVHRRYSLVNETIELVKDCPVERWEVNVDVPAGQELSVQMTDPKVFAFQPSLYRTSNSCQMAVNNVPQQFSDTRLPDHASLYPSIHFYNGVPEWEPAFDRNGLELADNVANQLIGSRDDRENITALRNYVVDNIHLNDLPATKQGFRHATASEVWQSGCGSATDKAVLLAAMLNQVGYNARVTGENSDLVGVMIDTLEYCLDVRSKTPMTLFGKAEDEVFEFNYEGTRSENKPEEIVEGFYRLKLNPIEGDPTPKAKTLALTRVAPMVGSPCNILVNERYDLPKGMKLIGSGTDIKLDYPGVGKLEIRVKQSGKKLQVVRNLNLVQTMVPAEEYARYRELVATWQSVESVLLKTK